MRTLVFILALAACGCTGTAGIDLDDPPSGLNLSTAEDWRGRIEIDGDEAEVPTGIETRDLCGRRKCWSKAEIMALARMLCELNGGQPITIDCKDDAAVPSDEEPDSGTDTPSP